MLALVKSLIAHETAKDRFDNLEDVAADLETGSILQFGAMPQELLSGARVTIGLHGSYAFGNDHYLSHTLDIEDGVTCHLIVAQTEEGRHLAISRLIDEDMQDRLFGAQSLEAVVEKPSIQQLRAKENVEGFKGWTATAYRKQLGDLRGVFTGADGKKQPFTYCLLLSPGHDYAIEMEKSGDGRLKVYATLYRPLGDIVHIALPQKSRHYGRKDSKARPWLSETGGMDALIETIKHGRNKSPSQAGSAEILPHPSLGPSQEKALAPALDHASVPHEAMLECDVRVAVKVIEEALLSKMPISEVVRRVLGLPVVLREKVFFSMPLSELDYQALAARWNLSPHDKVAIRYHIVRELSHFAGEA